MHIFTDLIFAKVLSTISVIFQSKFSTKNKAICKSLDQCNNILKLLYKLHNYGLEIATKVN